MKGIDIYTNKAIEITVDSNIIVDKKEIPYEEGLPYISPGFFDIQVNGYKGIDYSGPDLCCDKILSLITYLAESGTTQHVPTIITSSHENICRNLRIISSCVKRYEIVRRAIPAIHVEGPYISEVDGPRGAHDATFVKDPSIKELHDWVESSDNLLKLITLAPERKGAMEYIKEAVSLGIVISIGHTQATTEVINSAISLGATCSTHLGNGANAMLPKLNNYIFDQLSSEVLYSGIIADGYHIPPSALKVLYKVKGRDKTILVSDVAFVGGAKRGVYKWGGIEIEVFDDGHIGLPGTPYLAGAGHLLDTGIAHIKYVTKAPLSDLIRSVTSNPLNLLALKENKNLDIGACSDITSFYLLEEGKPLDIISTIIGGKIIYTK